MRSHVRTGVSLVAVIVLMGAIFVAMRQAPAPPYEVVWRLDDSTGRAADPPLSVAREKLGTETRAAIRVRGGDSFEIEIPEGRSRLLFSTGARGAAEVGVGFRFDVSARTAGGWRVVYSATVDESDLWLDHVVEPPSFPPSASALRFQIAAPEGGSSIDVQGFWGSVTLLQPGGRGGAGWGHRLLAHLSRRAHDQPSVVLVSLDTLGARHLGAFENLSEVSPFLDALLERSFSFRRAFAQFPNTLSSHASLLAGLYPKNHHTYKGERHKFQAESLATVLARQGYLTAAVTENGFVGSAFGFDRGFDFFSDGPGYERPRFGGNASATFATAAEWLERYGRDTRFFLFVHTYEVHTPYLIRDVEAAGIAQRVNPDLTTEQGKGFLFYDGGMSKAHNAGWITMPPSVVEVFRALYSAEINYLDRSLAELMERIDGLALPEPPLLVVTSDHGEEFNEHGKLGHGKTLYNPALHVPLAFHWEGRIEPGTSDSPVQLIDVMPTLLDLAGLPRGENLDGASLAPLLRGEAHGGASRPAFAEADPGRLAVQTERFKLISSNAPPLEELYDLEADPEESRNVASEFPEALERLRALIAAYAADMSRGDREQDAPALPLDEGTRERLRALGYLP
ncbi:sulfatase-like hydrolase/transferase [bacterium]|nr:sulfatase-like hydrolase/transferase [bacterium]